MKTIWKQLAPIESDRYYVAVTTELIPKRIRSTGRMFRGARQSSIQIVDAPGIVGFATLAQPLRRRYQTISLWESDADVDAFARSADHHRLVRTLAPELESVTSTRWAVPGRDGRLRWAQARSHLQRARA